MAISKNGNGMMHGDEPASVAGAHAATSRLGTTRASRIAGRPLRSAEEATAGAAEDLALRGASGAPERKYSFNALLAVGFLGYVVGRLLSR